MKRQSKCSIDCRRIARFLLPLFVAIQGDVWGQMMAPPPPPGDSWNMSESWQQNDEPWFSQVLPQGIIYRSYWAGVHEPRLGVQLIEEGGAGDPFWDPTVG